MPQHESNPSVRPALYCRVSTQEQAQAQSIETQVEFGQRWFDLYGIIPVRIYRDEGVSGTVPLESRPAGAQLLADLAAGRVNAVHVYRVDRLARDIRLMLAAVHRLENYGAKLVSLTESFDTSSPSGRAMLGMLGVFAQYERDSIAERSMAGRRRIAREGRWPGGWRPPFGYQVEEGFLTPNEEPLPGVLLSESEVVRLIYRMLLEDGQSCYTIAEHLSLLGVPTAYSGRTYLHHRTGKPPSGLWSASRVRDMITNPTYGGMQVWGVKIKDEPPTMQPCVPLVSKEIWDQAQEQLRSNRKLSRKNANRDYLLRGLLKCALCGRGFTGWAPHASVYYVCSAKVRAPAAGMPKCPSAYVPERHAEEVWDEALRVVSEPQYRADILAQAETPRENHDVEELASLDALLAEHRQQRDRVLTLYRKGRIGEEDVDAQLDQVEKDEGELRARRATLLSRLSPAPAPAQGEAFWRALQQRMERAETIPERRAVLGDLIEVIMVDTVTDGKKRVPTLGIKWRLS